MSRLTVLLLGSCSSFLVDSTAGNILVYDNNISEELFLY